MNTEDVGVKLTLFFFLLILGEGKMILRGDIVGVFFVFLQFKMLKKEITAERLQVGAVHC